MVVDIYMSLFRYGRLRVHMQLAFKVFPLFLSGASSVDIQTAVRCWTALQNSRLCVLGC